MKKKLLLFLFIASVQNIFGQQINPIQTIEMDSNSSNEDSLKTIKRVIPFYRIEREGYPTSFLMGTIHIVPQKYVVAEELIQTYLTDSVRQLYLEVANISNIDPKLYKLGAKDRSFLSYFTAAQQDSIFEFAETQNITKGVVKMTNQNFKPLLVQQLLTKNFASGDYSYDLFLNGIANEKGITVKGLEDIKDQLQILDASDSATINQSMMEFIQNPKTITDSYNTLLYNYFTGEINKLQKMIADEYEDEKFIYNILDKRNLSWTKKLKTILKKEKTFIAVGAGHLAGPNGLINLLQKQGFKIIPIEQ